MVLPTVCSGTVNARRWTTCVDVFDHAIVSSPYDAETMSLLVEPRTCLSHCPNGLAALALYPEGDVGHGLIDEEIRTFDTSA